MFFSGRRSRSTGKRRIIVDYWATSKCSYEDGDVFEIYDYDTRTVFGIWYLVFVYLYS